MIFRRDVQDPQRSMSRTTQLHLHEYTPSATEPPAFIFKGPGCKRMPLLNFDSSYMPVSPRQLLSHHRGLIWGCPISKVPNSPPCPTSTSQTSSPMMQIQLLLFKSERNQYRSVSIIYPKENRIHYINTCKYIFKYISITMGFMLK